MLLVLMLAVAVLTITMLEVAQNYRRSIMREREVEMIHRGVQYERAVRIYYRKNNGAFPTSIEQLENTNKVRYLRKRYKDPMSPDGQWQIAHVTDIKLTGFTLAGAAGAASAAAGSTGLTGAAGSAALAATSALQANSSNLTSTGSGTAPGTDSSNPGTGTSSTGGQTAGTATGNGPADTNGTSSNGAGPVLGGGPMLGVISKSKAEGIHSFNDKSHYNEWYFIYDPSQDKGQQPNGPYNPSLTLAANPTGNGAAGGQSGTNGTTPTGTPTGETGSPGTTPNPTPPGSMPPGVPVFPGPFGLPGGVAPAPNGP
jgi:hypothetical protein